VSGGPKQIACLQLDHAHACKYVTNLGKKKHFTAGWLAQLHIKMKRLKRKNERETEREIDKRGSNMFAHGQVLYTLNDLSGMSTETCTGNAQIYTFPATVKVNVDNPVKIINQTRFGSRAKEMLVQLFV